MMNIRKDEDLFAESTMTFGEHLEELRGCLIKALLGLLVGLVVGLAFGNMIVQVVKGPLEDGLQGYYQNRAVRSYAEFVEQSNAAGNPVPYSLVQITKLIEQDGYTYTKYLIHPSAVRTQLGIEATEQNETGTSNGVTDTGPQAKEGEDQELPAAELAGRTSVDLVPLFVWRKMTDDERVSIKALSAQEAFMIWLKASLVAGFIVASPWIFYQIWSFVAAGLYPHEKSYVRIFLPFSIGLFLSGAAFCFFIVFPFILDFLFQFNDRLKIDPDPRISEWLSFAIMLPVGFGISFQLPLVMLFLERIGVFDVKLYLAKWRIAVLIIFVIAMLLTPADPMSMLAMAIPLTALYFGGVALCRYMPKRKGILDP